MTDQAKNSRRIAKGNFTRKRNILIKSIETSQGIEVVETNYVKLVDAWEELERKHLEYVNLLTDEHLVDKEENNYSNAFMLKMSLQVKRQCASTWLINKPLTTQK